MPGLPAYPRRRWGGSTIIHHTKRQLKSLLVRGASVSSNIMGVTEAANQTGASAGQMLDAAGALASEGDRLRSEADRFLGAVRSA